MYRQPIFYTKRKWGKKLLSLIKYQDVCPFYELPCFLTLFMLNQIKLLRCVNRQILKKVLQVVYSRRGRRGRKLLPQYVAMGTSHFSSSPSFPSPFTYNIGMSMLFVLCKPKTILHSAKRLLKVRV